MDNILRSGTSKLGRRILASLLVLCTLALPACAQQELESEAASGDVNAELKLAASDYVNSDYADVLKLLEPLAQQGNSQAMSQLGYLFFFGRYPQPGQPYLNDAIPPLPNQGAGVLWWKKAASLGNGDAMYYIGWFVYDRGLFINGDAIDPNKSFYWLKRSAAAGCVSGMSHLGWLYFKGIGTTSDYNQAYYWMKKAAAGGSYNAKRWLVSYPPPS